MPRLPVPAYRLDLWTASAPAGGTRVAFLREPGCAPAAMNVQRTRFFEPGRSALSFEVAPDFHALASLAPMQGVVRLTRFRETAPDTIASTVEEWVVTKRERVVRGGVGPYRLSCVPLEEILLDVDTYREISAGGLSTFRFGATERTPTEVLTDLKTRFAAIGYAWIDVGTVTPTAKVTFALERTATPRALVTALVEALTAIGVDAEFQFTLASDLSEYRLELVTRVAGSLAPLLLRTDAHLLDLTSDEDALEQASVVIPFGADGMDLRELQLEIASIDAGTGWLTLQGIGGTSAQVIAADDQFGGHALTTAIRLFRELTGRSFGVTDTSLSPQRVRMATADLGSGLAAGERVSFRASEDNAGTRRAFGTVDRWSPFEVQSTLTSPPRIRTDDLYDASAVIAAANQFRDWTAERSTLVAALPSGTFNHITGVLDLGSAPSAAPQVDDWVWFPTGLGYCPGRVTAYNGTTHEITLVPRYPGTQFTTTLVGLTGARCYRPIGTPMWIKASLVANNELEVDAFTGGTPAAGDVLEVRQACQGVRLVELIDPAAVALTRRKVGTVEIDCTGATNRVPNGAMRAWAGASGDPPDSWSIVSIVGTVTRTRVTDPLLTRYGTRAWQLEFAAGGSAEILTPVIPIHPVPGLQQVAAGMALKFTRFTGNVPVDVSLYRVSGAGTRTRIGDPVKVYPLDTTVSAAADFKAALNQWYDAVLTNALLADWSDESLQLGLARPAGAGNPACTVVVDAAMLLQREGLPTHEDGGVRWIEFSDALPLLVAGNLALQDRAYPLLRFTGRWLDLHRLDGLAYPAHEAVPGRDVQLTIPPLALTRTVRLLGTSELLDDIRTLQGEFDRVRPAVGRLLAARTTPPVPAPAPVDETTRPPQRALLTVTWTRDDTNYYLTWSGAPTVERSTDGGITWAAPSASPITVARSTSDLYYRFRAVSAIPGDPPLEQTIVIERSVPTITDLIVAKINGTQFTVDWAVSGMPSGVTYRILWEITADGSGSGTQNGATDVQTITATSLGATPAGNVTLQALASDGSLLVARIQTGPFQT